MPRTAVHAACRSLALLACTAPACAQGAVNELSVNLFPGGFLDLETGVVLSVERFGDVRADLALKGVAALGKVAPEGLQHLEPVGGAAMARLVLSSRAEVEKLFHLPVDDLRAMPEPLGGGGGFVVRSSEGHYARLWLRPLPSGAVEVNAAVEDAGVPRFAPPPSGLVVEVEGGARRVKWIAEEGRHFLLRRRPLGNTGDALAPEAGAFEREVEGIEFLDATAAPEQGYVYELVPRLDARRRGLGARVLSLPLTHRLGAMWTATVANGTELDLYAARVSGSNVHVRVLQAYETGVHLEPGNGASLLDGRGAQQSEGAIVVGEEGFTAQQVFVQVENEAYVRTAEGLLGRVRLLRVSSRGRSGFGAELEIELAPYGADGFLRAPAAPHVEWSDGRVAIEWQRLPAASASELGRRVPGGEIEVLSTPPDSKRFEEPTPDGALAVEYLVRVLDAHGRRSPWSPPSTALLVDPSDGPRLLALVEASVRDLLSEDEAVHLEGERRLRVLGPLAASALQRLVERGGEEGELARELLRDAAEVDAVRDVATARVHLEREIASLPPALRAAALEDRRGVRLFTAILGGAQGDAADADHVHLRRALVAGDPDAGVRRAIEAWTRLAEADWAASAGHLAAVEAPLEPLLRYTFDAAAVETRFRAAASGDPAPFARWIAGWASASAPHEAWALLTWAEIVAREERAEWPLVRAGLEMLAGRELGSREAKRAARLAELHGERARCSALARIGSLFRGAFPYERTISITPEEGLARLLDALQHAAPGTRIVLEPGRYEEDPTHGPLVLRGDRVRIEAREPGAVVIAVPVMIEDARELSLAGIALGAQQGFAVQALRSTCTLEDVRIEGAGVGFHFAESFVWLRGCRLLGRPNATGILLRDGVVGVERCLIDGYQVAVQAQGNATAFLSRSALTDLGFAVARGNGEGSSLYVDRCAVVGNARQVFTNFPSGAVGRLLLAGVGAPGTALGEGFAVDGEALVEIDGDAGSQWGGARMQSDIAAWFDAK